MKKRITLGAALLCAASMAVGAVAANVIKDIKAQLRTDFTVVIDGEERVFKTAQGEVVYPVLYEGTTYLPVRAIGEIMGKEVYWYENDKRIELRDRETTVTDADVIIGGADAKTDILVTDNEVKENKNTQTDKKVDETKFIGVSRAKEIALKKAGFTATGVKFIKAELDHDDGIWKYEVEFSRGITEYDVEIKAETGDIIKFEKDLAD